MKRSFGKFSLIILICCSFIACATWVPVPLATPEQEIEANKFEIKEDKALVYIYKPRSFAGGAWPIMVYVNGKYAGKLGHHHFFMYYLEPGIHTIRAVSVGFGPHSKKLTKKLVAGDIYFFGMSANRPLMELPEDKGKAYISKAQVKMAVKLDLEDDRPVKFPEDMRPIQDK
jgi:hypothetical protein